MKTRTLSLILAMLLCIALLPLTVSAASDPFGDKFFSDGKLEAFGKSYVDIITEDLFATEAIAYTPIPDMLNDMFVYLDTADDPIAEFGLYSSPLVYYQCDIAIDDPSAWMMQEDWNWDQPDIFAECGAYDWATTCESFGGTQKLYEHNIFDLYWENTQQQLGGICNTVVDGDGYTQYQLDLENHTLYFRFRYVVVWSYEADPSNIHRLISPWSEVTSVGKNGTQKPLTEPTGFDAPVISDLVVIPPKEYETDAHIKYDMDMPESLYNAYMWYSITGNWADIGDLEGQININNRGWQELYVGNAGWIYDGERSTTSTERITKESYVQFRVRWANDYFTSPWSNVLSVNAPTWEVASSWAEGELREAQALGLIPDCLIGADMTQNITRAEFAAVCVKTFESLSGSAAAPAAVNPFTDTNDTEILKAYEIGAVAGVGDGTKYAPNDLLTREQMATMLTRVYKKHALDGWTLPTDGSFTLTYDKPAAFADDKDISSWAYDSVYFMASKGIILGSDNKFMPRAMTAKETAIGYATATREMALLVATRMVKNLG